MLCFFVNFNMTQRDTYFYTFPELSWWEIHQRWFLLKIESIDCVWYCSRFFTLTYGRNTDNTAGNEKIIVLKEDVTVTYISLIFDCYAFVVNFKMTIINMFHHIHCRSSLKWHTLKVIYHKTKFYWSCVAL